MTVTTRSSMLSLRYANIVVILLALSIDGQLTAGLFGFSQSTVKPNANRASVNGKRAKAFELLLSASRLEKSWQIKQALNHLQDALSYYRELDDQMAEALTMCSIGKD
jgi:hypothetical protein